MVSAITRRYWGASTPRKLAEVKPPVRSDPGTNSSTLYCRSAPRAAARTAIAVRAGSQQETAPHGPSRPRARATRSAVMGKVVTRTPVASSMALASAAAGGPMGGSPMPRAPNGPNPSPALDHDRLDVGHVGRARDQVRGERRREVDPVLEEDLLHQPVAESLHGAALDLPGHALRIDGAAHVVSGDVLEHAHAARSPRRPRPRPRGPRTCSRETPSPGPARGRPARRPARDTRRDGCAATRRARTAAARRPAAVARPSGASAASRPGGASPARRRASRRPPRAICARSSRAGLEHRVAGHVELAAGRRGAGQRGQRAVRDVHGDALQLDPEHLGGDLAERGGLPPPTSGTPQRTTRLPSISNPTQALAQS